MKHVPLPLLTLALAGLASAQVYRIDNLGDLGAPQYGVSVGGINDAGQIAGSAYGPELALHGYLWQGGTMHDIGNLGGSGGAGALNNSVQIVGSSYTATSEFFSFVYENGTRRLLGDLGRPGTTQARAINAGGQVVGNSSLPTFGMTHAFRTVGDSLEDIGTLGGYQSDANGINDDGVIVGQSTTIPTLSDNSPIHAFRYSGGTMQDLGTLGGSFSSAGAINGSGLIVGGSGVNDSGTIHAFLYANGAMQDLGTLGGSVSGARAINASGRVVGWSRLADGDSHGFTYANGAMRDLNGMIEAGSMVGYTITEARGINASGQIAAQATRNGTTYAVLLTPVPEPTSLAALGLGALTLLRRRRHD